MVTRVLTPEQRKQYNQILKDKGQGAAKTFRDGIIASGTGANQPGANSVQDVKQNQTDIAASAGDAALTNLQGAGLGTSFTPQLTDRTTTGNLEADRSRIEDAVFGTLTRDLDQNYENRRQQVEQTLRNKGIPFSADPKSRYQQELGALNRQYDDARLTARQTATEMGGQEYQRNFDIGETLRSNQFAEQAGTRNQQLGEVNSLSGMGLPGVVGFEQLSDVDKQRALEKALAQLNAKTSVKVANIGANASQNIARMNLASRGGGSSEDSPFNSGL